VAFLTRSEAIAASRATLGSVTLAEAELRKTASAPTDRPFDIFLSHSFEDADRVPARAQHRRPACQHH
jgi:hypothetical protein